jgi:hypothetical protein
MEVGATPMWCTYSTNFAKRLDVNTKCFPSSLLQGRLGFLYIYSVEKYWEGAAIKDIYPGYLTKMTQPNLIVIDTDPCSNKMMVEYCLEIESYFDNIKSCN